MGIYVHMHGVVTILPSKEELSKLSYDLVSTFGIKNFYHYSYDNGDVDADEKHLALEQIDKIGIMAWGDVVQIEPEQGEYFICIGLEGAYYGFGYERGNFWLYKSVAEWLEYRIPGIVIYYGGDEVYPIELTKEYREMLWENYMLYCRSNYYDAFSHKHEYIQHPLCPLCEIEMHSSDGNQDEMKAKFNCRACDRNLITEDGGERFHLIPTKS